MYRRNYNTSKIRSITIKFLIYFLFIFVLFQLIYGCSVDNESYTHNSYRFQVEKINGTRYLLIQKRMGTCTLEVVNLTKDSLEQQYYRKKINNYDEQ